MEISQTWALIIAAAGWIVVIFNAIEKIIGAGKALNAPYAEVERRLTAIETRCDKYDRFFDADKQKITDLEQMLAVLMQAQFALLSHAINGNDIEKLKEVQSHMMDYLTKRGISV